MIIYLQENEPLRVMYNKRNILNLGANLREPTWHQWNPRKPVYDPLDGPKESNSVYFRLETKGKEALTEDYPLVS